jgi:hypothetical protein
VEWLVEANILEKRAVCTLPSSALKMETARFSKMLASTNQSTKQLNPKRHNHFKVPPASILPSD